MLICDQHIDIFCLTETWLQQHVSINESTPSDYLHAHIPRTTGEEEERQLSSVTNQSQD